ncbi:hypothetical protein YTPLAS18_29690 [Nitrospira sp.]|nr:hypothetical protein YTPLAS18_29690 [Nitrospira sp.]
MQTFGSHVAWKLLGHVSNSRIGISRVPMKSLGAAPSGEQTLLGAFCIFLLSMVLILPMAPQDGKAFGPSVSQPRFQSLNEFEGEAILDTQTGLIWERAPHPRPTAWYRAKSDCGVKVVGGRRGWRLPSFFELMTLVEPSLSGRTGVPLLPAGHPFTRVSGAVYWSSDTPGLDRTRAYIVDFLAGDVATLAKTATAGLWCVKGVHLQPAVQEPPRQVIDWMMDYTLRVPRSATL